MSTQASTNANFQEPEATEAAYARMKWLNWWRLRIGWLLAVLVLIVAPRPSVAWLIAGCLLVAVGLAIRIVAASTLTKIDILTTQGIYALTRNPLYLGSLLVGLGFGALGGHWLWLAVCGVLFGWIYRLLILAEEEFLAARYGPEFAAYCERVPRLFPRFPRAGDRLALAFSWEVLSRNKEPRNIQATFAYLAVMLGKIWWLPAGHTWWTGRIAP